MILPQISCLKPEFYICKVILLIIRHLRECFSCLEKREKPMPFCLPFSLYYHVPPYLLPSFLFLLQFVFPQVAAAYPSTFLSALHLPLPFCLLPPRVGGPGVCGWAFLCWSLKTVGEEEGRRAACQ